MTDKINGRTPEEVKHGLEICSKGSILDCDKCPYAGRPCNDNGLQKDAHALIQQLEAERDQYRRERDAAVEDLEEMGNARAYCDTCLYANSNSKEEPCSSCASGYLINNWQWRGVQEET